MKVWYMLVRRVGWRLALASAAGLAAGASLAALMRLIHRVLTLPAAEMSESAFQFAWLLGAYFAGIVIADHSLSLAAERLQSELRQSLMRQVLSRPLRQLERLGLSRLSNIVGGDVKAVTDYVCWLPEVAVNLAITLGCFAYMAWLSPLVFGFNLLFVSLAAGCYIVPEKFAVRIGRKAALMWDRHIGQVIFGLQNIRRLLLSRPQQRDFMDRHFGPTSAEVRALNVRRRLIHLLAERFAEVMVLGNVAVLLFLLPRYVDLPSATLTGLLLAALFVRAPLKSLLEVFPSNQSACLALERMEDAGLAVCDADAPRPPLAAEKALSEFRDFVFDKVSFHYESDHDQAGFLSGPFSLQIRAGEIIFIVGGNGAGKTTLAKLLCGLYAHQSGTIWHDGVEVSNEDDRERLRSRFSAVFTEDPLFGHVLGVSPEQAESRGNAFLKQLRLSHKVALLGTEFSTTDLSQGQRRRLLLIGALLEDRPVLLLDEWAADQDPQFRAFFYDFLLPLLRSRGKTLLLITHDDRYFDRADRVLKIDNGQIADVREMQAPVTAA